VPGAYFVGFPVFDKYFDALCELCIDGEEFEADVLSDSDFSTRLSELTVVLKTANPKLANRKARQAFLANTLFVGGVNNIDRFVDPKKYANYLELWTNATNEGFIPEW
jgi:hypothetical protein